MKRLLVLFLFSLILALPVSSSPDRFSFFQGGKTEYVIMIPTKATPMEHSAARILALFLKKSSGAEFPIVRDEKALPEKVILVGATRFTASLVRKKHLRGLREGGYLIQWTGARLVIAGGAGKGCIHGVTTFLEQEMRIRYLSPDFQVIPRLESCFFTGNRLVASNPATPIRIVNGSFSRDSLYRYFRKLDTIEENWGEKREDRYYVHTFNLLVPPDTYFQTHPEYYSLINGERVHFGQLCLTNPDIVPIVVNNLRTVMARNPGIKYWSVSQNDNYYACTCDRCKAIDEAEGSPAGTLLRFVNQVADSFPDKVITTLAYQYTRKPPKITRPAKNVMITHCSIELNRSLPIEQDPSSREFVSELEAWGRMCDFVMLWDYEVQFTNYLCPFPLWNTLAPNIRLFNRCGTKAHFQQCNAHHGVELAELKSYLMSHLLWNPDADSRAVIEDFMKGYYGPASPFILAYFDRLNLEAQKSGQRLDIYGSPVFHSETFLSETNIQAYHRMFDKAEAAADGDPALLDRVRIARLPLLFSEMEIAKTDIFGPRGWYEEKNGVRTVRNSMRARLDTLHAVSIRNNIPYNEKGLFGDLYYQNCLRTFDVQTEGNLAFRKPVMVEPEPAPAYTHKGAALLTNGVRGNEDWKLNWLGWEGQDCRVELDLGRVEKPEKIILSTLHRPDVWILHPTRIECQVSADGVQFESVGDQSVDANFRDHPMIREFSFNPDGKMFRYLRFQVTGTRRLPAWHAYAGEKSWVFLDEITVR